MSTNPEPTCPDCGEELPSRSDPDTESTWQQIRCECGSWVDSPITGDTA